MPPAIAPDVIEAMFAQFCKGATTLEIAHIFGLCDRTVQKYMRLHDWDKRREDINIRLRSKLSYDIIREKERNIRLIQAAKSYIVGKIADGTIKAKLSDLPDMIRTELLLVGEPDSRVASEPINQIVNVINGNGHDTDTDTGAIEDRQLADEGEELVAIIRQNTGNGDRFKAS